MIARSIFAALLTLAGCGPMADGAAEGRRGVELLGAGEFEAAAAAFETGLETSGREPGATSAALLANLGLARFEQGLFEEAAQAFTEAIPVSFDPTHRAAAAFGAGTSLAHAGRPADALAYLRQALIIDPEFTEARFNYEVTKRRLKQEAPESGTPPTPTAFAESMKARADSLVAQRQYQTAAELMDRALERDSTVAAFSDFMQRLGDVVAIDTASTPAEADSLP